MPTKKTTKSRTSSKKSSFKFRWWMAAGLVAVVAIVGIVVLRFSHAAYPYTGHSGTETYLRYDGTYDHYTFGYYSDAKFSKVGANLFVTIGINPTTCWEITPVSKGSTTVTIREVSLGYCGG